MSAEVLHLYTMYEYGELPVDDQDWLKGFIEGVDKATAGKDTADSGGRPFSLVVENHELALKASSFVGVFSYRGRTVEVLPKVFRDAGPDRPSDDDRKRATRTLLFMLEAGGRLKVRWTREIEGLFEQRADFVEVLRYIFADSLLHELRAGPCAAYIVREEELAFVRGSILFDRVFPWTMHRPVCRYHEYVMDNDLNRVLYFCCHELMRDAVLRDTRRKLAMCMAVFAEQVSLPRQVGERELQRVRFTRLNDRFKPSFDLARLFLHFRSVQMMSGQSDVGAFFLDMNRVFEDFAVACVEHVVRGLDDGWRVLRQGSGRQEHLMRRIYHDDEHEVFRLKPDALVVDQRDRIRLIVEIKWKDSDFTKDKAGIVERDFYQITAYAVSYSRDAENHPPLLMVYPEFPSDSQNTKADFLLTAGGAEHRVTALKIPIDAKCRSARRLLENASSSLFKKFLGPISTAPVETSRVISINEGGHHG